METKLEALENLNSIMEVSMEELECDSWLSACKPEQVITVPQPAKDQKDTDRAVHAGNTCHPPF